MNTFFDRERQRAQQANQALRDQIQRQSQRLQENGRRIAAAGWTSPDATGTHTAVSGGATPSGLVRRWRRSHIGQARGVQQHSPRTNTSLITSFRLETFDAHTGRRPGAPVRFRGQAAVGFAGEGDWVEAAGFRWGGTVRVRKAFNHSTGARYRRPLRRTAVIAGLALLGAGVTTGGAAALLGGAADKVKPPVVSTSTSLVAQESTTTTTAGDEVKPPPPFDIGNPDSRSLPPEHRASTLGPELTKKLSDKAKAERRPWKDVVLVAVGPVTNLQPEARFDFLGQSEDMVERLRECLVDDGAWKACAEPVVGDSATLKAVAEPFRLAAWPKAPAITEAALSCLLESKPDAKGKQWTGCSAAALADYWREDGRWKKAAPDCDDQAADVEFVTCVYEAQSKSEGDPEPEGEEG